MYNNLYVPENNTLFSVFDQPIYHNQDRWICNWVIAHYLSPIIRVLAGSKWILQNYNGIKILIVNTFIYLSIIQSNINLLGLPETIGSLSAPAFTAATTQPAPM